MALATFENGPRCYNRLFQYAPLDFDINLQKALDAAEPSPMSHVSDAKLYSGYNSEIKPYVQVGCCDKGISLERNSLIQPIIHFGLKMRAGLSSFR